MEHEIVEVPEIVPPGPEDPLLFMRQRNHRLEDIWNGEIMEAKTISSAVVSECLRKDNYANWSVCVKSYLLANDLWQVTEEIQTTGNNSPRWIKMNAMALHAIQISCGPDILSQIRDLKFASEAWNSLDKMYGTMLSFKLAIDEQGQGDPLRGRNFVESGDLNGLTQEYNRDPGILGSCSSSGKTLLHYAVMAGQEEVVRFLVPLMPTDTLQSREAENNYTALALAAITLGKTKIAEYIVEGGSRESVSIEDRNGFIPVVLASAKGHKHMTRYLFNKTPLSDLGKNNRYNAFYLLYNCIRSEILDIALKVLESYRDLRILLKADGSPHPLTALARVPSAFPSGRTVKFWDCLGIRRKVDDHHAVKILDYLCENIRNFDNSQLGRASAHEAMLEATKHGIVEFIEKMKVDCPRLLLSIDSNSRGIFSYAILYRRVKIFNFIYGLEETRGHITSLKDKFNNNLLHLAGMPTPPSELVRGSGAALQMQRELQWFQAVERVVHPKCKEELNIDCQKPRELFTITHENLMREGEKWAQETARSFTVVGILIATIMFAAAFTVPGGNNQLTGIPIFLTQKQSNQSSKFWVFAVADAISLFTSSTSVLVFLVILTSRFAEEDFLVLLPIKLIVGLSTLFISVVSMLIAFCAALQLMLDVKATFIIWVYTLAGLTILPFVAFQSPLFLEICRSTIKKEFLPNRRIQNWQ